MKRRSQFCLNVFVILGLLIISVNSPVVQGAPPPELSHPHPGQASLIQPFEKYSIDQTVAAAGSLGQPGLSFRYVQTFGVTEEAYPADVQHINNPAAVFVDASDNLFVVEESGNRLLKYRTSDGANLLSIGKAGFQNSGDNTFDNPTDVAVDGDGNFWVVDKNRSALVKYDASGHFLLQFPADWTSGSDNDHFNQPRGLIFDSTGRLYVSDAGNERIQVFDLVSGTPVYSRTIGVTGVSSSTDGYFSYPSHITIDSIGRLYVVDSNNYRVQRCTFGSGTWTCVTFFGMPGVTGTDLSHLGGWFNGLTIRNDNLFIADTQNHRVLKCDTSAVCTVFAGVTGVGGTDNTHFLFPSDVALDSAGNVYVSEYDNHRVQEFTSAGVWVKRFGVTQVPYVPDTNRYNTPQGITVADDGSIYLTEGRGYRLVKLNAAGTQQWTVGQAGVNGSDNAHFTGVSWIGLAGNMAVDAAGRVYVPDTGNDRIQIFDASSGAFITTWGSSGSSHSQFSCPWGVAISPVNGDFYVVDKCNNRIQVFDSSRVYKTQLGTGVYGASNTQFARPQGVAIDKNGNIFVDDNDNERIQKCTLSGLAYNCSFFAGVTGQSGDDFGHFSGAYSLAVDVSGRVYLADAYNSRIQVFDSTGAYLTTIGGSWGSNSGQLREPKGVAVDSQGNVYVADSRNSRIQKFSPGVPGWQQANLNGFGDRYNRSVLSLEAFNGTLYAGTFNWDTGGSIYRSTDARAWTQVTQPGFGNAISKNYPAIIDMAVFNGQIYAGTGWGSAAGQLWRSSNGTTWEQVDNGFSNAAIVSTAMATFNNMLYVGTGSDTLGFQIWRSDTGNSLSWNNVLTGGHGNPNNRYVISLIVFNGNLFAAVEGRTDPATGLQIWRSPNGSDWSQVGATGFGSAENYQNGGFAIFNGNLYVGTRNDVTGGQVWRSGDGSTWTQVVGDGFGDSNNYKVESLHAFGGDLYAGTDNSVTGVEIWRSADGTTWSQINPDGFGDSNNDSTLWSSATAVFNNRLFIGTWNWANGGEVWRFNIGYYAVYLPLVVR